MTNRTIALATLLLVVSFGTFLHTAHAATYEQTGTGTEPGWQVWCGTDIAGAAAISSVNVAAPTSPPPAGFNTDPDHWCLADATYWIQNHTEQLERTTWYHYSHVYVGSYAAGLCPFANQYGVNGPDIDCSNTDFSSGQPDLIVSVNLAPNTGLVGSNTHYTATVKNQGTAAAGPFQTDFYTAPSSAVGADGKLLNATNVGTDYTVLTGNTLAAGATKSVALDQSYPSSSTIYLQACPDIKLNQIAESNENNNCGAPVQIVFPGAFQVSCSASPTSATTNQTVTWTANASGGTSPYTYTWNGTGGISGLTGRIVSLIYHTAATETASVTVTDSSTAASTYSWVRVGGGSVTCGYNFSSFCQDIDFGTGCTSSNVNQQITCDASDFACPGAVTQTSAIYKCEFNAGGQNTVTQACSNSVVVTAAADLVPNPVATGANLTIPAATAGTAVTITAGFLNQGSASTYVTFPDLFEFYPGGTPPATFAAIASGGGSVGSVTSPILAGNTSNTVQYSQNFPSSGQWQVRACANTNTANGHPVSESNVNNNCGNWYTITVAPGANPDLVPNPATGANLTIPAATAGTPVTITAAFLNQSTVSGTGSTFPDLFEFYPGNTPPSSFAAIASGGGSVAASTSPALAANASNNIQYTENFPSGGQWEVRACANMDASGNVPPASGGVQNESSYANNCGNWYLITVTNGPSNITGVSCGVVPPSGTTATQFRWYAAGATGGTPPYTYHWSGDTGGSPDINGLTGAQTSLITYGSPGTYAGSVTATDSAGHTSGVITCTAAGGNQPSSGAVATVSSGGALSQGTCVVSPSSGYSGNVTRFTWTITPSGGTPQYTFSGWKFSGGQNANNQIEVNDGPSLAGQLSGTFTSNTPPTDFQVQVTDSNGNGNKQNFHYASCEPTLSTQPPSATISANPTKVSTGGTTVLTYNAGGVNSCTITSSGAPLVGCNPVVTNHQTGGTCTTPAINSQTQYTLNCDSGAATAAVIVNLLPNITPF